MGLRRIFLDLDNNDFTQIERLAKKADMGVREYCEKIILESMNEKEKERKRNNNSEYITKKEFYHSQKEKEFQNIVKGFVDEIARLREQSVKDKEETKKENEEIWETMKDLAKEIASLKTKINNKDNEESDFIKVARIGYYL